MIAFKLEVKEGVSLSFKHIGMNMMIATKLSNMDGLLEANTPIN